MELNEKNYFSQEAEEYYVGSTQIKNFLECEARALAMIKGEWEEEQSKAMALSSYVDALICEEEVEFITKEREKVQKGETSYIILKSGKLSTDAELMVEIVEQAENDSMFIKYLKGKHQVIKTGEIEGVPVKIKIDSSFPGKVNIDLKAVKDFNLQWNDKLRIKQNFIDYYNYSTIQAPLYQEIDYQNTGIKLPFIIAAMTKEKYSERALLNIPQETMDEGLQKIKEILPRIQAIKQGKIQPSFCGCCNYCKSLAKVTNIYNYNDYFEKRGGI